MKNDGRMANGADPDQTNPEEHSDQGLHCMPLLYCLGTIFLWLKDRVFTFQNNRKNLDWSWDCLGRAKLITKLQA